VALHRDAARLLGGRDASSFEIPPHLALGARAGDSAAVDHRWRSLGFQFRAAHALYALDRLDEAFAAFQIADREAPSVGAVHLVSQNEVVRGAAHCHGLVHNDTGALTRAVTLLRRGCRPLALAAALEDLGVGHERTGDAENGADALTDAEIAVVKLVAEGRTSRGVEEQLYLSTNTVNTYLRHVFTKLGLRSRVELPHLVFDHDWRRDPACCGT
jgi:DNA-binding CsgD family transcriptional regulator